MTTGAQQDLSHLDAEVREHVERVWPQVVEWNQRLSQGFVPEAGSALALDDEHMPLEAPLRTIAWLSLGTGSQHLLSTLRYLREFGPVVWSLQSMMRTAIWGGAQAIWLLAPEDRATRVANARQVAYYSTDNYRMWLDTFDPDAPSTADSQQLVRAKAATSRTLSQLGEKPPSINQTRIVKEAAQLVHPQHRAAAAECEQSWRSLGAVAHALPWELETRATGAPIGTTPAGLTTTRVTARWAEMGGELGFAHEFLSKGWSLLDQRSAPAPER